MSAVILLAAFVMLLVLCWPLAVLMLLLVPFLWLLALPFRLLFLVLEAALALIRALLFLPARLLGFGRH